MERKDLFEKPGDEELHRLTGVRVGFRVAGRSLENIPVCTPFLEAMTALP
jgi:hypothetical protein